jgi:lysophospholipase L1-like esterase
MRAAAIGLLVASMLATSAAGAAPRAASPHWVGTWASSQMAVDGADAIAASDLKDATLRQIVRLTAGGGRLRVKISNAFGTEPLRLASVHVARAVAPDSPRIEPGSDRTLTFNGRTDVTVPAGADYLSDPIDLSAPPLSHLAVSFHFLAAPTARTSHPGSRATSYLVHGDRTAEPDLPGATRIDHWFALAGVEVAGPGARAAVVALGDSITDGHGATTNGDDRWPDVLARRLQADPRTRQIAVLNHGIGGNRLLEDGLGPNALARFDRDVLAQAGVRYLIVLEGVNDLGVFARAGAASPEAHAEMVRRLIGAYGQIAARAHAHGIKVIGATILPFGEFSYYHPDAAIEADRQAVNRWIRTSGVFDAVVDFDAVARDPKAPDRLLPAYDSGDHLHPGPAGYKAMGEAVPLSLFAP